MSKRRNERMYGKYETETYTDEYGTFRRCIFCGEVKPISDYPRDGHDNTGKARWRLDCKVCYNIRRKANKQKKTHNDFVGGMRRRGEDDVEFSHQEWKECLIFFSGECAYCGSTPRKNQRLTRDHLVPISKGGLTEQANIVPACSSCNSSKGAEEFKAWYMRQPYFSQERLNRIFRWRTIMRMVGHRHDCEEDAI